MKKYLLTLIFSLACLTGCSLIPKKVELFQDKVHRVPEASTKQKELQREAAQKANEKAAETLHAALAESASTNIVVPAEETERLTAAVAESVGAPAKAPGETDKLIQDLHAQLAKLDRKLESFRRDNDENAGKKIEGTGLVQVPYFAWTGGILVFLLAGWYVLRTVASAAALANPGAAVGVGALNVAGNVVSKGFQQLVKGGEEFKEWAQKNLEPAVHEKVLEAFTLLHKTSQDDSTKALVDHLRK